MSYTEEELLDKVSEWHAKYKDAQEYPELHEFLGWSWEEYKVWFETSEQS